MQSAGGRWLHDHIDFTTSVQSPIREVVRKPGTAKGRIWISPDFDETREDFRRATPPC
jgi:hypothetical protein